MDNEPITHVADLHLLRLQPQHFTYRVDEYGSVHVTAGGSKEGFRLTLNFTGDTTIGQADTLRAVAERLYAFAADIVEDERLAENARLNFDEATP